MKLEIKTFFTISFYLFYIRKKNYMLLSKFIVVPDENLGVFEKKNCEFDITPKNNLIFFLSRLINNISRKYSVVH